jgi:hypothetical protein
VPFTIVEDYKRLRSRSSTEPTEEDDGVAQDDTTRGDEAEYELQEDEANDGSYEQISGPQPSYAVNDIDLEISPESLAALDRLADLIQEGVDNKADEEEEDANEQNEPTTVPDVMPNDESEDDNDDDEERRTTPEQAARLKETKEQVRQIIADADRLAEATSPETMPANVDVPTPQIEDEFTELVHRIIGDAFHLEGSLFCGLARSYFYLQLRRQEASGKCPCSTRKDLARAGFFQLSLHCAASETTDSSEENAPPPCEGGVRLFYEQE